MISKGVYRRRRAGGGGVFVPDFYVDSVSGNDSNDGLTTETALATISALQTSMATVGTGVQSQLVSGSTWLEQFNISQNNADVRSDGLVTIDAASEITGTWAEHADGASYPDVWQISWTRANPSPSSVELLHYWEDGTKPSRYATSLADLQANGGWFADNRVAATTNIYIKPAGDPNADGILREASDLEHCIHFHGNDGGSGVTGVNIEGPVELKRAVGHYGPLSADQGISKRMLLRDGVLHHVVTAGSLEDVICVEMPQQMTTAYIPVTQYKDDGTGLNPVNRRTFVIFTEAENSGAVKGSGFYAHGSPTGFDSITHEQCATVNAVDSFYTAGRPIVQRGTYSKGCAEAIRTSLETINANGVLINRPLQWGAGRFVVGSNGSPFSGERHAVIENMCIYKEIGSLIRHQRNGTLTIKNCIIVNGATGGGKNTALFGDGGGDTPALTVNFENNIIVQLGAPLVGAGEFLFRWNSSTVTFNSDNNIFLIDPGVDFRDDGAGTTYGTFSAYQGAGYDENSVIFTYDTLADARSVFFQGDPADGDFRLKDLSGLGTFGDGSALDTAGPQQHWNWNARGWASGPPSGWPVLPATLAEQRTYIADPAAWDFYPPATAPSAFVDADWSVATGAATGGQLDVTIATLPSSGGATITDVEYDLDASGTWVSSGGTGNFTITGLTASTSHAVRLRAVNSVGAGAPGNSESATASAAATSELISNGGFDDGTDWSNVLGSAYTISGGVLSMSNSEGAKQLLTIPTSRNLRVSFDVVSITGGTVFLEGKPNTNGISGSATFSLSQTTAGSFTADLTTGSAAQTLAVRVRHSGTGETVEVDNVSILDLDI